MKRSIKRILALCLTLGMVLNMNILMPSAVAEEPGSGVSSEDLAAVGSSVGLNMDEVSVSLDKAEVVAKGAEQIAEEPDMKDGDVRALAAELKDVRVKESAGSAKKIALSTEQIQNILGLYTMYLNFWEENKDVMGVQVPFYLRYNDDAEDGLGILGEMLVLSNVTVDDVRNGNYTYDEVMGMIMNFYYGDMLGVQFFGQDIRNGRDEVIQAIKDSGAQTDTQKLLVINDWLAAQDSFDMSFIMNSGKEQPYVSCEDPQKHRYYDYVYEVIYDQYEESIGQTFHDQIYNGIIAQLRSQYYEGAVLQLMVQYGGMTEEQAGAYIEQNRDALNADPDAFIKNLFGAEAAAQIAAGAEAFIQDAETNGVEVDPVNAPGYKMTVEQMTQMQLQSDDPIIDVTGDGVPDISAKQAIPVYTAQAAAQMSDGIISYWDGSRFGVFGDGLSVCLGYTQALAYLMQVTHPEIYGKNGANTDMTKSANWKTRDELYKKNSDGSVDIDSGYNVDFVRIQFNVEVSMYGESAGYFTNYHFWNAVKVDGEWYYIDSCYTDVYSEVMLRDRVETDGSMNHMYFMLSDASTRDLYDGYFQELATLYEGEASDDTSYEDTWFTYSHSNSYSDGTYMYYSYDSQNMLKLQQEYGDISFEDGNFNIEDFADMSNISMTGEQKLVRHKITNDDKNNNDYEALIEFNHPVDEEDEDNDETVARVYVPQQSGWGGWGSWGGQSGSSGRMVENELLTELYAHHAEQAEIYPSIAITCALDGDLLYFNLSDCLLSYNINSGEVKIVKQFDTVYGLRDRKEVFASRHINMVSEDDEYDYMFENHPIAGIRLDGDQLTVSIATNMGFVSGKDDGVRSGDYLSDGAENGYGYEFEESNYNPSYSQSTYSSRMSGMSGMFGMEEEINDNDEFMWAANVIGRFRTSDLTGSVEYKDITCDHHFVKFNETYFTKDDSGRWNTGESYVCVLCGKSVEKPSEPQQSMYGDYDKQMAEYELELEEYNEAVASAKHDYVPVDAEFNDDMTAITFSELECSVCSERQGRIDCLEDNDTVNIKLRRAVAADVSCSNPGSCDNKTYTASGQSEGYNWTFSRVISGHSPVKVEAKAATCTEAGNSEYYLCRDCGGKFLDADCKTAAKDEDIVIPKKGHETEHHAEVAASCDTAGSAEYWSCSGCGKYYSDEACTKILNDTVIPALGHNTSHHDAVSAECGKEGSIEYWSCSRCGKNFADKDCTVIADNIIIPALTHDPVHYDAVSAECGKEGAVEHWYCDNCRKCFEDEDCTKEIKDITIPALKHKLEEHKGKAATCETAGSSTYFRCTECGKYYSDEECENEIAENSWVIEAKGHKLKKHDAIEPACEKEGREAYYECDDCHKYFADAEGLSKIEEDSWVIGAKGHDIKKHDAIEPTCEKEGNEAYYECTDCHKYFADAEGLRKIEEDSWVIEAKGHKLTKHDAVDPTCDDAGNVEYYECSECGGYFADEDGKLAVEDGSWVLPAKKHSIIKHDAVEPTCEKEGREAYYECSDCHKYFADAEGLSKIEEDSWVIEAKGHSIEKRGAIEPTCEKEGREAYYECTDCHKYFADAEGLRKIEEGSWVIEARGHKLTKHDAVDPTCDDAGNIEYYECSECGGYFADDDGKLAVEDGSWVLPAKKHSIIKHDAVEPACEKEGREEYYECDDCHKYFADAEGLSKIEEDSWVIEAKGHDMAERHENRTSAGYDKVEYCEECSNVFSTEFVKFPFKDVETSGWFFDDVFYAWEYGLVTGVSSDKFGPDVQTNRAMIATLLYRMEGSPEVSGTSAFNDVVSGSWYEDAVIWAADAGIVKGISAAKFAPDQNIIREQLAAMMFRYAEYKGCDVSARADLSKYKDQNKVSSYAVEAMSWANAEGLIKGISEDMLGPAGYATRAQAAAVLHRFKEDVLKKNARN